MKNQGNTAISEIRLVPMIQATADVPLARRAASNAAAELESFQVAIGMVLLARDITISGSAWGNPTATPPLYDAPESWTQDLITAGNALDASNDPYYIDFMTAAGLSRLSTSAKFQEGNLGDYNFAIVNWSMPFRVRAAIALGDGQTVYTKPAVHDSSRGGSVSTSSMMSGPAETAVAVKQNGGAWFRFLRPLTISAADLNTTELVHDTTRRDSLGNVIDTLVPAGLLSMLLIFNPDGFLTAWDSTVSGGEHQSGDLMGPGGIGDNIVAASLRGLVGPAGEIPVEPEKIFFVVDGAGGTLTAQSHDRTAIVDGFRRLAAAGATGTADLRLGHVSLTGAAYAYLERRKMN